MRGKRRIPTWVVGVAFLMLFTLPVTYFAAYFLRSTARNFAGPIGAHLVRYYPTELEAKIFEPAAEIESKISGSWVSTQPSTRPNDFLEFPNH